MTVPTFPSSSPTSPHLKVVLWALFLSSCASAFFPLSLPYLGLSISQLSHGYAWTLLTYPFASFPYDGPGFLLHLGLNLLILWMFGSPLIDRVQPTRFFVLFFGSTLFAGLSVSLSLFLFHNSQIFASLSPPLLALIVSWAILHAEREVSVGHAFAIRPLWIFLLFGGITLLSDLLETRWIQLIADLSGALFGYFFCLISERTRSTLPFLFPFERAILRSLERQKGRKAQSKVVDIHTGKPMLSDEQFMDAMLARISAHGEHSLSSEERKRMQDISLRKSHKPS